LKSIKYHSIFLAFLLIISNTRFDRCDIKQKKLSILKKIYIRLLSSLFMCLLLISGGSFAQIVRNGSFESFDTGTVTAIDIKGWLLQVTSGVNPATEFEIVNDVVEQKAIRPATLSTEWHL
jgi:hypothetical protein